MKTTLEIVTGLVIAAAAVAWRYWNIDSILAIFGVLIGVGFVAHAFGYENWLLNSNFRSPS